MGEIITFVGKVLLHLWVKCYYICGRYYICGCNRVQPATRFYLLVALIHCRKYFGSYHPPPPPQPQKQIDTLANSVFWAASEK